MASRSSLSRRLPFSVKIENGRKSNPDVERGKRVGQDLRRLERKQEAKETVPQGIQGKPMAEPRSRTFADSIGAGKGRVEGLFQRAEILPMKTC